MRSLKSVAAVAVLTATALFFLGCDNLPFFPGSPYGNNTTRANAFEIELESRYGDEIKDNDEARWFKFTTEHPEDTWDEVRVSVTVPNDDLIVRIEIFDAQGKSLQSTHATTRGQDHEMVTRRVGGLFYVRFSGAHSYGLDHGSSGRYSFKVENLNSNDPYGPNHTIDTAYEVSTGQTYDGVLVNNDEADFFVLKDADPTATYRMDVTGVSAGLYIRLVFFDQSRNQFGSYHNEGGGDPPQHFNISNFGDTLYIRFSGATSYGLDHGSRGSYSFKLEKQ